MRKIDKLWKKYKDNPDDEKLRNRIVEHYVYLVPKVAASVHANLPKSVQFDDIVSAGYIGLMDAVEKFDPERGIKFETYSMSRIRGQMLDDLRSSDWVPRSVRSRARHIEKATTDFQEMYGRSPSDEEIAEVLEISVDKVRTVLNKVATGKFVNLDQPVAGDEGLSLFDVIPDGAGNDDTHLDALMQRTVEAIEEKDGREAVVISLYYYEGLTLADIGRVLGVTESRVCQIHTKAISGLDLM